MSAELDPPPLGEVAAKPTEGALDAPRWTRDRARELRGRMSLPEVLLWIALRKRQADGLRFRRQHPIGPYILDFYCEEAKFAVEVDGEAHGCGDNPRRDARRDAWVGEQGVHTFRLPASEVLRSPDDAVTMIKAAVEARAYLRALQATLEEWDTPEDAAAFDNL